MKNCPNCGAVMRPEHNKCEYCGTSYFDLTSINFDENKPIYMRVKTCGKEFLALCRPELDTIEIARDTIDVTMSDGTLVNSVAVGKTVDMYINFHAIAQPTGELIRVMVN